MRAIGYYRIRSSRHHETPEQLEASFYEYCESYLHQPIALFGDVQAENEDGSQFPEYDKMLEYINSPQSNFLVIIPNTTHLGTNLEEVVRSMLAIEATGCKIICNDDMPDPSQNALESLGIRGVSRERSRRIKKSMRERAVMGKGLGKPPYGYRNGADGTLEIVEEEAPIVELIYHKYTSEGLGLRLIAQYLNERDITTRRGGRWNMVTIRDILRNPTYMGTYTRFGLRLPKSHPAIIPPQTFRATQDQTRARRPSGRSISAQPFLLSGLSYCGYCENKMMGVTRRQSWRRKDGRSARGVYRYYQCQTRNNQSLCGYHTWRASALEQAVLTQLADSISAHAAVDGGVAAMAEHSEEMRAVWEERIRNAERRLMQNLKRVARGELGLGALTEHLHDLDKARADAENPPESVDAREVLDRWDTLEFTERQAFLHRHIAKIVVLDDSIQVMT